MLTRTRVDVCCAVLAVCVVLGTGTRVWGVKPFCNGELPAEEGNCGEEGPEFCDVALPGSQHETDPDVCNGSVFIYHQDYFSYDKQVTGDREHDFAEPVRNGPPKRCTCRHKCSWDDQRDACVDGGIKMIPNPNGFGIIQDCPDTRPQWVQRQCDPAPGS